jgi:copper(I)-binding protein
VLSACGAGKHALQYQESSSQDAVSATVGSVTVRNVFFIAPVAKGMTAILSASLNTVTPGDDDLVNVVTPFSTRVAVAQGGSPVSRVQVTATSVPVVVSLSGVTQALAAASYYPVTFSFARAGDVTLNVPVLRAGVVAGDATSVPTAIPERPIGVQPLDEREPAVARPQE